MEKKEERHVFRSPITDDRIDIKQIDTVMIAGKDRDGKEFVVYAEMELFFKKFANNKEVPYPLPGLRPYRSREFPLVRFRFDPAQFNEHLSDPWKPTRIFCDLLKGKLKETPSVQSID